MGLLDCYCTVGCVASACVPIVFVHAWVALLARVDSASRGGIRTLHARRLALPPLALRRGQRQLLLQRRR